MASLQVCAIYYESVFLQGCINGFSLRFSLSESCALVSWYFKSSWCLRESLWTMSSLNNSLIYLVSTWCHLDSSSHGFGVFFIIISNYKGTSALKQNPCFWSVLRESSDCLMFQSLIYQNCHRDVTWVSLGVYNESPCSRGQWSRFHCPYTRGYPHAFQ